MNLALAVRALVSHSKGLLLASLLLGVAPGLASADGLARVTSGPDWACAHTTPVPTKVVPLPGMTCSCKGSSQTVQGEISFGGVRVGIGQAPPKKDMDGLLVCRPYIIRAGYDAYTSGGQTTVAPGNFVNDVLLDSACDKSDCGQALGFLWSTGDTKCVQTTTTLKSGHQSYKVTGRACDSPLIQDQGTPSSGANGGN